MSEVYEYTDDNTNIDENSLTVDFILRVMLQKTKLSN